MQELTIDQLTNRQEFHSMVEITRNIMFEVSFYRCGGNKTPHFSTSANELNRPKSDYKRCGQAQDDLLPKGSPAMKFYKKWDPEHLNDLSIECYDEMINDLKVLDLRYNVKIFNNDSVGHIPFYEVVAFSKTPLKPKPKLVKIK